MVFSKISYSMLGLGVSFNSTLQINYCKSIPIRMAGDNKTYPLDSQNSGSKSSESQVLTSLVSFRPKIRPVHLKTGEVFFVMEIK